jgi:hypothetical protein
MAFREGPGAAPAGSAPHPYPLYARKSPRQVAETYAQNAAIGTCRHDHLFNTKFSLQVAEFNV